jgi:hypothetical protein
MNLLHVDPRLLICPCVQFGVGRDSAVNVSGTYFCFLYYQVRRMITSEYVRKHMRDTVTNQVSRDWCPAQQCGQWDRSFRHIIFLLLCACEMWQCGWESVEVSDCTFLLAVVGNANFTSNRDAVNMVISRKFVSHLCTETSILQSFSRQGLLSVWSISEGRQPAVQEKSAVCWARSPVWRVWLSSYVEIESSEFLLMIGRWRTFRHAVDRDSILCIQLQLPLRWPLCTKLDVVLRLEMCAENTEHDVDIRELSLECR